MVPDFFNPQIDPQIQKFIRKKIKKLVRRSCFSHEDREDLEQELLLKIWQRLPKFDPTRGPLNAFWSKIIDNTIFNFLRDQKTAKRKPPVSLSLTVKDKGDSANSAELSQTISQGNNHGRSSSPSRSEEELAQIRIDVAETLAHLPEDLRKLAEQLKNDTVSEIARKEKIPRTTLYGPLAHLKRHFERYGLKNYL